MLSPVAVGFRIKQVKMAQPTLKFAERYCAVGDTNEVSFDEHAVSAIQEKLVHWYGSERRKMPWRGDNTSVPVSAYGVWISEVMLQQTRVETVIDYWMRWMAEFPDVSTLASATPEDVNRLWAGLGYYRRAQFLLQGAKKVVSDYGGVLPQTVAELLKIPGIGPYTAGAISSIVYGQSEPLVDGNVMRVFSRLLALKLEVGGGAMEKHCWKLARELVPAAHPGDFNQALMELGATVCKPTSPSCSSCPVREECQALALTKLAKEIDSASTPASFSSSATSSTAPSGKAGGKSSFAPKNGKNIFGLFAHVTVPEVVSLPDIEDTTDTTSPGLHKQSQQQYIFDTHLLPREVTEFPRKVAKKKPKELVFSVCVLRTKHLHLSHSTPSEGAAVAVKEEKKEAEPDKRADTTEVYKYLFVRRPDTGLLANQWEFPCVPLEIPGVADCDGADEAGEDGNAAVVAITPGQRWAPFPSFFLNQLSCLFDSNGPKKSTSPEIKPEGGVATTIVETASRDDFEPIVHVFSHQRHTMHITLKDVVVLGAATGLSLSSSTAGHLTRALPPVEHKWMTAAEIVAAGITTGCKKVLQEVTKEPAKSDSKKSVSTNAKNSAVKRERVQAQGAPTKAGRVRKEATTGNAAQSTGILQWAKQLPRSNET